MPSINNQDSFTFHIRLTKKCNADCSYCSSFERVSHERMDLINLEDSLDFIIGLMNKYKMGGNRKMITVQYVGGEITTLPTDYLNNFCTIVKNKMSPLFEDFQHGVQSNLIASKEKINLLVDLFENNIGTSVDNFTEQRTVKSSSSQYKTIFLKNLNYTKKILGHNLSSILVVDDLMYPHVHEEIKIAEQKNMSLTLRPVFQGGMKITSVDNTKLTSLYEQIFHNWFMKSNIKIEPHFSLLKKRLEKYKKNQDIVSLSGCPFQSNCITSSINLEPNGDLYTCLDMADSKNYLLGNTIKKVINEEYFSLLLQRSSKLSQDCFSCDYYNECQGGCMNEAIEHTNNVFGKTLYCDTWKNIFSNIDQGFNQYSIHEIEYWLNNLK